MQNYTQVPKNSLGAFIWAADVVSTKVSLLLNVAPYSDTKSIINFGTTSIGLGAAIYSESALLSGLTGYSMGNAINNLPVYSTDMNMQEWWSETLWGD
jgi:hypothetical protein